jgi:hypothetical protein
MNKFLNFIGGFIAGILATLFVLFLISLGISSNDSEHEFQVTYVEVTGKKGNVTLHTGMSKDSVQILVGKPDEIDSYELGNTYYEKWGFKLKNEYVSDLDIDFEDGKLKGVR